MELRVLRILQLQRCKLWINVIYLIILNHTMSYRCGDFCVKGMMIL